MIYITALSFILFCDVYLYIIYLFIATWADIWAQMFALVSLPGCFVDLLHPWLDQPKPRVSVLSYGPQEPEHPGSKSGTLFGRLPGEAALAAAGAVQLWAGPCWNYIFTFSPVLFCESKLRRDFEFLLLTQSHVAAGDQLVHSAFLQSLASLTVGLSLEKHLCRYPRPPHHTTPDAHSCPSEWSWLATYAITVRSAEAIASGTAFPESFIVSEFQEQNDSEITKALVSDDNPLCAILCSGNVWICIFNVGIHWDTSLSSRTTVSGASGWMNSWCHGPPADQR